MPCKEKVTSVTEVFIFQVNNNKDEPKIVERLYEIPYKPITNSLIMYLTNPYERPTSLEPQC